MDGLEQTGGKTAQKAVTLNRIVAPKHVRIMAPVAGQAEGAGQVSERAASATGDATGEASMAHARAAADSLRPLPIDKAMSDAPPAPGMSPLAKMGLAGLGLLGVIGGLLVWGAQAPAPAPAPQSVDATAPVKDAPVTGARVAGAAVPMRAPTPRPVLRPVTAPAASAPIVFADPAPPQVELPAQVAPLVVLSNTVRLPIEAVQPTAAPRSSSAPGGAVLSAPRPAASVPAQGSAPAPLRGQNFMEEVTLGTVAALRGANRAELPSASETALMGFVRVLADEGRSISEIAAMLEEARAGGNLDVPGRFLRPDGRIDPVSVLTALEQWN